MTVLLIAEDDDDVSLALRMLFSRAGFTVLTASDGAAALQMARTHRPDVVLTDQDMPAMTGLDLCRAIRQHPDLADIPVAILSGSLQPGDPRAAAADVCGVLLKPFSCTDLLAAVQHLADLGCHDHTTTPSPCAVRVTARQPAIALAAPARLR